MYQITKMNYHDFVINQIEKYKKQSKKLEINCLDVGAGYSPLKEKILKLGINYYSLDKYTSEFKNQEGMQNSSKEFPKHDFEIDILDFKSDFRTDIIVLTEFLEHTFYPTESLNKCVDLLQPNGILIITTPLLSLIHQAPNHFYSGFSPYYFERYQQSREDVKLDYCKINGDYTDLMQQEIDRLLTLRFKIKGYFVFQKISKIAKLFKYTLPKEIISSGGLTTFAVFIKND